MKKKSYTKKEVAELIGVTTETINNWTKDGTLPKIHLGSKNHLYPAHIVDGLLPSFDEINIAKSNVSELLKELKEKEGLLLEKERELRKCISMLNHSNASVAGDILEVFIQNSLDNHAELLFGREMEIVKYFANGKSAMWIAKQYDLSKERIYQILYRALLIIRRHNIKVSQKESELIGEISRLESKIERLEVFATHSDVVNLASEKHELAMVEYPPIWDVKVADLDLTIRCLNCLKCADITTIADLISLQRNDFLKYRNFGRKTLNELDDLLRENGLEYGTDTTIVRDTKGISEALSLIKTLSPKEWVDVAKYIKNKD